MKLTFSFKKNKKATITLIVIVNLIFLANLWYISYGRKLIFDHERKLDIDCSKIKEIMVLRGHWNPSGLNFFKVPQSIDSDVCSAFSGLPSLYIENSRPNNGWIDIELIFIDDSSELCTIGCNSDNEIFLEFDGHTYNGEILINQILNNIKNREQPVTHFPRAQ